MTASGRNAGEAGPAVVVPLAGYGAVGIDADTNHWVRRISRGLSNIHFQAQASAFTECVYPVLGDRANFQMPVHGRERWSVSWGVHP